MNNAKLKSEKSAVMKNIYVHSCPFCKKIPEIYVFDGEGNEKGELGCDYEKHPWSGLSYGIVHIADWGTCFLGTDEHTALGGMLFDTAEEAAECWNRAFEQEGGE